MTTAIATRPAWADGPLPTMYERAIEALQACVGVDECKDWSDRAAALATYAKQSKDTTLIACARRIQDRAMRRAGELLAQFQSPGCRPSQARGGAPPSFSQRQIASRAGMSKDQEKQARRVAAVPVETFEALMSQEIPPSVTKLASLAPPRRVAPVASAPEATRVYPDRRPAAVAERLARIRTLASEGSTSAQIAAALQISVESVRQRARQAGIDVIADRVVGKTRRHNATRIVEAMVQDAENLTADVNLIDFSQLDPSRVTAWLASLRESRQALTHFMARLTKEGRRGYEQAGGQTQCGQVSVEVSSRPDGADPAAGVPTERISGVSRSMDGR